MQRLRDGSDTWKWFLHVVFVGWSMMTGLLATSVSDEWALVGRPTLRHNG